MSMKFRFAIATALACAVTILPGCGGSGTEVAQTPKETIVAAPVTDSSGEEDEGEGEASYGGEEDYGGEDYGGEGYGEESAMASRGNGGGRGGRGGRSGGRPSLGAGVDAGYGEEEMMASGGGGEYGDEGGYSMPGYSMGGGESEYGGEGQGMSGYSMGGGYAGEGDSEMVGAGGPGMGGGFGGGMGGGLAGGMGGSGPAGSMVQFVSQNCFQCHGRGQAKGGVRLDSLDADFGDKANAELWTSVVDAVESGEMPPANSRRIDPQQKNRFLDMVRKAMDEAGVGTVDYLADAKKAFGKGREKAAIEYLYAHIVTTDDEQADALLRQSRWFAYGKQPTTTLRFATGVILDAPTTLTDVKPIGSSQMGGGGFGGEGMGMGRGGRGGAAGNGQRDFVSLTGDLGRSMVGAFESRWTAGNLGTIFSEVVYSDPAESRAGGSFGSNRGFGGMGMGGMGMGGPGYGDGEGQGGYGGGMYGGRGYGGESGRPGGGGESGYGGEGYGGEGNIETTAMADLRENIMPGQTVTPGLIYLGEASQADLIARAKARGVDAVFIFDVDATRNRMGVVNNETRIRLVPVEGKPMGATKILKNTEVERARLRGTGDDDVQKNIDRLFKVFDDNLVLTSMPSLKPEHAKNRIRQLLAQREALPEDEEAEMDMTVLYETRLFNSMGIITNEEMSTVYQIVLRGNEGETLATGSVEDKQMVIEGFLTSL